MLTWALNLPLTPRPMWTWVFFTALHCTQPSVETATKSWNLACPPHKVLVYFHLVSVLTDWLTCFDTCLLNAKVLQLSYGFLYQVKGWNKCKGCVEVLIQGILDSFTTMKSMSNTWGTCFIWLNRRPSHSVNVRGRCWRLIDGTRTRVTERTRRIVHTPLEGA